MDTVVSEDNTLGRGVEHKTTSDFVHSSLAAGRWAEMSFAEQMGNIGSEVSRSLKWFSKKPQRFQGAFERALELFDLSISAAVLGGFSGRLEELCRAREEFCDYFNGNSWGTDGEKMMKYYDEFVG